MYKIFNIVSVAVLILTAILRIVIIIVNSGEDETEKKEYKPSPFAAFSLSFYLIGFAVILILVEFGLLRARVWFYLLNFSWGKGLFSLFVGLFLIAAPRSAAWFDILMACVFFIVSIIFFVLHCYHKQHEPEHVALYMAKYNDDTKLAEQQKNNPIK